MIDVFFNFLATNSNKIYSNDINYPKNNLGTKIIALKNVTYNEPFFRGHFPGNPIMPGVLQIEAMAQTSALASSLAHDGELKRVEVVIASIKNAKFRKPVVPGDSLRIVAEITRDRSRMATMSCKMYVDDQVVSEADLVAVISFGNLTESK